MNQFVDCFLADVIVLFDSRMGQSLDSEVYFTATSFLVPSQFSLCSSEWSEDVLASELVVSWRPFASSDSVHFFAVQWETETFCCTILLLTS